MKNFDKIVHCLFLLKFKRIITINSLFFSGVAWFCKWIEVKKPQQALKRFAFFTMCELNVYILSWGEKGWLCIKTWFMQSNLEIPTTFHFWPRSFADAVLGTAYLLLLLLLLLFLFFLENFFEFHEKSGHSLHCK